MSAITSAGGIAHHVHLGFWTNWSKGRIDGATITITRSNGGLLIAFLAIFVGAAGKSFWRLCCFVLHRRFSRSSPQDAIYHQRQAILRNANTAQDAAWTLALTTAAWRGRKSSRAMRRLLPLIAAALLISAAFGVAGIFSSHITTDTANEVLVQGDSCGPLDSSDSKLPDGYLNLFEPYLFQRAQSYNNYALRCYTNTSNLDDCNIYVRPGLPATAIRNASCPFAPEMCKTQTQNLIVDTGYLDSHEDLGINSPPEERFQMRLYHQCAPIVTDGFSEIYNGSAKGPLMRYYYGAQLNTDSLANFTYQLPLYDPITEIEDYSSSTSPNPDYSIGQTKAYSGKASMMAANNMFTPIPQLNRTDADVMLFYLSGQGITFTEPSDDL